MERRNYWMSTFEFNYVCFLKCFFHLEKYQNNIFLFLKNYFLHQHIKMIKKHLKNIN